MSQRILNLAFVGNGRSANRYHIPFILTRPQTLRVRYVYEAHPGTSKWKYLEGIQYTGDLDQVLNDPEVDVVCVTTPSEFHYDYAMKALHAGKGIVVEKPFALNVEQAEEVFAFAHEQGLYASAFQNRRFDSDFLTLQRVLASGKLGKVYEITEHFDYWRPETPENVNTYSKYHSFVYGYAVHTIDQAVSMYGKPDSVRYDVRQLLGQGRMNDYFDIDMNFGDVRYTVASSYFRSDPRPSFEAYGTRGHFVKQHGDRQEEFLKRFVMPGVPGFGVDEPDDYGVLTYYDDQGNRHEERVPTVQGDYTRMYDTVYDSIVNGANQVVKPEQTITVMHMLEDAVAGLA